MQQQQSTGDKFSEALAPIIDKSLEVAERTGEFAIEQAPLILQEFYMWYTAKFIFFIVIGVLCWLIAIWFAWFAKKQEESGWYFGTMVGFITGCTFIVANTYQLVYITVAPRLFIIEHFIHLSR